MVQESPRELHHLLGGSQRKFHQEFTRHLQASYHNCRLGELRSEGRRVSPQLGTTGFIDNTLLRHYYYPDTYDRLGKKLQVLSPSTQAWPTQENGQEHGRTH